MYTREQVERAILDYFNDGMEEDDQVSSYDGELLVSGAAVDVLDIGLGVPDAEDRVEWYNATMLDAEDIMNLANVEFSVSECENCGEKVRVGNPENWGDFQGVLQDEDLLEVTLEPLGTSGRLCGECIGNIERMLPRG